ncbi:MAG: cytidine deaminase [Oscillospiraceae bacterium]|nr:cytidine deaminase [Oscillospiraceae bacterium]
MSDRELLEGAEKAYLNAYAPYSHFRVGAALLCESGEVYTDCNVENSSYGVSCCAERTALYKAVSEGERKFTAIAIACDGDEYPYPCGICRQALSEFGTDLRVIVGSGGEMKTFTLEELLPSGFSLMSGEQ